MFAKSVGLTAAAFFAALTPNSCKPSAPPRAEHDNAWVIAQLDARLGKPDADDGGREFHVLIRRQVKGEEIICGWAGFSPLPAHGNIPPPPSFETIFIVRSGRLYLEKDLPPGDFERWQDQLCGDQWVKPLNLPGVS